MKKKIKKKLTTPTKARATSFATRQDLAHFAKCVTDGGTAKGCLNVGDNGVGAWGDDTWRTTGPAICALPATVAGHNKNVRVTLSIGDKKPFECICRDVGASRRDRSEPRGSHRRWSRSR